MQRRVAVVALILVGLAAPSLVSRVVNRDVEPPEGLGRPIADFGTALANQLDQPTGTHVRFLGHIFGAGDQLLILTFELRPWPHVAPPTVAYLASRCVPLAALDPYRMGGGVIVGGDVSSDPEVNHLRDPERQPPCKLSLH
jgi:hypothetical protein